MLNLFLNISDIKKILLISLVSHLTIKLYGNIILLMVPKPQKTSGWHEFWVLGGHIKGAYGLTGGILGGHSVWQTKNLTRIARREIFFKVGSQKCPLFIIFSQNFRFFTVFSSNWPQIGQNLPTWGGMKAQGVPGGPSGGAPKWWGGLGTMILLNADKSTSSTFIWIWH